MCTYTNYYLHVSGSRAHITYPVIMTENTITI